VPDWTYHPLRPFAAVVLGQRRWQRAALRVLATVTSLPGGIRLVAALAGHLRPPAGVAARLGVVVPVQAARDAIRALPPLGAGVIELGPVGAADVALVRRAVAGRRCAVIARAANADVAVGLAPYVDRVVTGHRSGTTGADGHVVLFGRSAARRPRCTDRLAGKGS
jgi:hypothetical protein